MTLLYDHVCNIAALSGQNPDVLALLRGAPVFEITNVHELFGDWDAERQRPISKRPPFPITWAEWSFEFEGMRHQVGCIVSVVSEKETKTAKVQLAGEELRACDEFFLCLGFRKFFGAAGGLVAFSQHQVLIGMRDECKSVCTHTATAANFPTLFGLRAFPMESQSDQVAFAWPPFMAFALLHCRNVRQETVQPEPQTAKQKKQGLPPKKEHRVLRLELPMLVGGKREPVESTGEEDARKVRHHLCRGHFKNLQHDRYKSKGWHWWPAHWKGSKEAGEASGKVYELHARDDENTTH